MATPLSTQMQTDMSVFMSTEEFAETVTYTVASTAATASISVVFREFVGMELDAQDQAGVVISRAVISDPTPGDKILRSGGDRWIVVDSSERDIAAVYCRCRKGKEVG